MARRSITRALDDAALSEQLDRFSTIGRHASWTRRDETELVAVLGVQDRVIEALAVEAVGA